MDNPYKEIRIKRITDISLMPDGTFDLGFIIDETPIEDAPALWPKENPNFPKKYLGKWNLPKEEKDELSSQ